MNLLDSSLSIANPDNSQLNNLQKIALAFVGLGILGLIISWVNVGVGTPLIMFLISLSGITIGSILFTYSSYSGKIPGIKNNGVFFKDISFRGVFAWILGIVLTGFYICLYWFPNLIQGLITIHNPLSELIRGKAADQWFVYGTFYTVAVLLMGTKFIFKYRHNRYQIIRTISVMFFQLIFAYLIPAFLSLMNKPDEYFSYFWPLDSKALRPEWIDNNSALGTFGYVVIAVGLLMPFVVTPIMTYLYGKRWYCSWVCGCGGLAETAGDPFRQLSDKSLTAWKIERWMIHLVLVAVVLLTALLWFNHISENTILGDFTSTFKEWYGFGIAMAFSGVIGVGFYPIMGSRVWCRFGCPMAAILGLQQKFFSRFRITTNGSQCISCGNCSTYCEMGIDVRSYAQKGQDIVRASCVGCGVCAAVCPRGVLRLENGSGDVSTRTEELRAIHISLDEVKILS